MAIALSKYDWERIVGWTDPNKDDAAVHQRQEYLRYLEETSREMTKKWPNSLENVNKRNEELRRARIEAAEQANAKFYKEYVKRKKEEQRRLMHSARDIVFKDQDAPKMLLSAVIETVVQKERQEQVKFNKKLREQAEKRKKEGEEEIIRKAKEWQELVEQKNKKRFEVNKQHQKEILEQAFEVSERNRKEYEAELNFQKIDNIKANQQMEAIKKFQEDLKAAEKARIWSDMESYRRQAAARRRQQAARDELDDQLQAVLQRARHRLHCRRRDTEEQIKKEKLQVLEKISEKLETGDAAREETERALLQKAIEEKEAIAEARRQANVKKQEQSKQERIEARRQFLEEEERRLQDFNTMRQWEIMNRFKNAELYDEYKDKLQQEIAQRTQEYKEELLKQRKEREDRLEAERAELQEFYGPRAERLLRAHDHRVLALARALVQEARQHQRPHHALLRATHRYCRERRLPAPALLSPAAPPSPAAPTDKDREDLRLPNATPPKTIDRKESHDHVRAGSANGLQRKDE